MQDKRTLLWLKQVSKPTSSDPCRLCGVNFKISIGDLGGKKEQVHFDRKFKIHERAGVDKIHQQIFWKYILVFNWIHKMENLPGNAKQSPFARA